MKRKIYVLGSAILILAQFLLYGRFQRDSTASANASQQFILFIYDSDNPTEERFYNITKQTLQYTRFQYGELDLATTTLWPRLGQYSAILIITESLEKLSPLQTGEILQYVESGGGVAVVKTGWNADLGPLFGLEVGIQAEFIEQYDVEKGLHFVSDFFPGLKGLVLDEEYVPGHSMLDLYLPVDAPVQVITTADSGRPISWINQYGRGRTIFWNTDFLTTRDARGLLVQSILSVQPVGVLPIANVATFQIDDFPAAVSTQKLEPIKTEYDLTMVDFYNRVWVPDILELSRRFDILYTFLIPFNYNPLIEPPFDFKEWEHAKVTLDNQDMEYATFVSHLVAQGHEMGLHGYNHVSLLVAPNYWVTNRDRERWLAAKALVEAQALITTKERFDRLTTKATNEFLSAEEQANLDKAKGELAAATLAKIDEAYLLLETKAELEALLAKEQQTALTPKESSTKTIATQTVNQAGEQKIAEAQALVSLPEDQVTNILISEAQARLAEAGGPAKVAEAAQTVAEIEQQAEDNMALALSEASKRWDEDNLGPQPVTYVPPNNIFHPAGTRALLRGFPTLKIMAGVYNGEVDTGGSRDFGPEPWNANFFGIPRVTAEYTLTPDNRFIMVSMLGLMGVWTHFVHPDDVFHTPQNYPLSDFHRNPNSLPWRGDHTGQQNGFYYRLEEWFEFNEATFPWLRHLRTRDAYDILKNHLENQVTVDLGSEEMTLKADTPGYYFVRINNGQRLDLNAIEGAQFIDFHPGEGYRLYVLRGLETAIQLKLLPPNESEPRLPPADVATPFIPALSSNDENIIDYQSGDTWGVAPIPPTIPTATPVPTATPDFEAIPIPTPTVRSRP